MKVLITFFLPFWRIQLAWNVNIFREQNLIIFMFNEMHNFWMSSHLTSFTKQFHFTNVQWNNVATAWKTYNNCYCPMKLNKYQFIKLNRQNRISQYIVYTKIINWNKIESKIHLKQLQRIRKHFEIRVKCLNCINVLLFSQYHNPIIHLKYSYHTWFTSV